jgi:hypothetical protein
MYNGDKEPITTKPIPVGGIGREPDSPILDFLAAIVGIPFAAFMTFYVGCLLYILSYGLYRGLSFPVYGYPIYVCLGTTIACLLWVFLISEWRDVRKNPWVCIALIAAGTAMMVVSVLGALGSTSWAVSILSFALGGASVAGSMTKLREGLNAPQTPGTT